MASDFLVVAGGSTVQKLLGQSATYTLDWTPDLAPGDTVSGAAWTVDGAAPSTAGGTPLPSSTAGQTVTTSSLRLASGGTVGWHLVQGSAITANGDTLQQEFRVYVQDSTVLGAGIVSAFPSLPAAVASIRRDRLAVAVMNLLPEAKLQDDYLLEKLVASEAHIQRQLRVYLTPVEMLPIGATSDEIAALVAAGSTVEMEPGYDYDPRMFQGNTWGLIELRQKPVIAIHSITFDYPAPDNTLFTIPTDWIRGDFKYGRVNLVPVQTAISLPLNAYILAALGGGRTVPLMLQVRYQCGLANCAQTHPDILDLIKKETVLSIVEDNYVPNSASDSADGLSQSISFMADKYRETITKKTETIRQSLHGVRMMVM